VKKAIWIAWETQIRNVSMSGRLGVELYVLLDKRGRFMRYLSCSRRTVAILWRERPTVVFAQDPSIVLTLLLVAMKRIFKFAFVTDAHFAGVVAPGGGRIFQAALDFANRAADLVIVTNEDHRHQVEAIGGSAMVCEDPLPDVERYLDRGISGDGRKRVFFICSYDVDEPYEATLLAARLLKTEGYDFAVSGNYRKAGIDPGNWPEVEFIGYVSAEEFYTRLATSQVVIDLTNQDNCLLCGAYEAMTLEVPLVTSNTPALRNFFKAGTVFVKHSAEAIAEGVRLAIARRNELRPQIREWKEMARRDNDLKIGLIREKMGM
jgi:glycosyltransferase involved in cell wall biosynthesis